MNRDELRAEAKRLDILGRSKMTAAELRAAVDAKSIELMTDAHKTMVDTSNIRVPKRTGERGLVNNKPMPIHHNMRAAGAKHYRLLEAIQNPEFKRAGERKSFAEATPMPNSERVQKYARTRETTRCSLPSVDVPKLTHRQMRRVNKKMNHHDYGLTFMYYHSDDDLKVEFSNQRLLARTPNGLGIFYQFAKSV